MPRLLSLPWIDNVSVKFEKQTKSAIKECYSAVQPPIIFATKKILSYLQRSYAHHSTKYDRISIRVPL